jgi:hypothetical protein
VLPNWIYSVVLAQLNSPACSAPNQIAAAPVHWLVEQGEEEGKFVSLQAKSQAKEPIQPKTVALTHGYRKL